MVAMQMRRDAAGRTAGIAVFIVGVLLLLTVFYLAYGELVASGALWGGSAGRSDVESALLVATKGLFLFLMVLVASAIANKGIGLYQAAAAPAEGGA